MKLVVAVIAAGGVVGGAARYGVGVAFPAGEGAWPWATLAVNTSGCLLIGVLMVLITEVWAVHRLVRPFFGVGVLGGFTTFSTQAVEATTLVDGGHTVLGLGYLAATAFAAMVSVFVGVVTTRALVRGRRTGGAHD